MTKAARAEFDRRMRVLANCARAGDSVAMRDLRIVAQLWIVSTWVGSRRNGLVVGAGSPEFHKLVRDFVKLEFGIDLGEHVEREGA